MPLEDAVDDSNSCARRQQSACFHPSELHQSSKYVTSTRRVYERVQRMNLSAIYKTRISSLMGQRRMHMSSEKLIQVRGVPMNCLADVVSHTDPDAARLMINFVNR